MSGRKRRRQRRLVRRITILATLIVISVSLVIGVYFATLAGGRTALDANIGLPVSKTDLSHLYRESLQPYGPAPSAGMVREIQNSTGALFLSNGKPVIVYIGGEYCPFCAIQRWSLIMALMRFGNFSNLLYMTSSASEGDLATFTFARSSYASSYIAFRPYEADNRNTQPLESVPSNYSVAWRAQGSVFPFMNFGNKYLVAGSMIPQATILQGKNWTTIISEIPTGDSTGLQIRSSANLITSMICNLTGNYPSSVCEASPIVQAFGLPSPNISKNLDVAEDANPLQDAVRFAALAALTKELEELPS